MILKRMLLALVILVLLCSGVRAQSMAHAWSKRFGDATTQYGKGVAVDTDGNTILIGDFFGTVNFGGSTLTSAGHQDILIAKFDAEGNHLWSKRFGDVQTQLGVGIAVDPAGNIYVTGHFTGMVNFGGGALTSAGYYDMYIAKFSSGGTHLWSKRFGDSEYQMGYSIAVDASENAIVTGNFQGTVNFGGGALTSAGDYDVFVVTFDAAGNHVWSKRFGDGDTQQARGIAFDGLGNSVVTGHFAGTVNFGGGALTNAGYNDIFVAKFSSGGTHLWSKRFGDATQQYGYAVAVDASANVVVTGTFEGAVNFGGETLTSAGLDDIFIAKFDSGGNHLWSKRYGDANYQCGSSVAFSASGNVFLMGFFAGVVNFGDEALTSAGSYDIFIAKFDAAGNHLWSNCFGEAESQHGQDVAVDASGNAIATGYFYGVVNFGGGALTSAGTHDIFIAKFFWETPSLCPLPSAAALAFRHDDSPRPHNRSPQIIQPKAALRVFESQAQEPVRVDRQEKYTPAAVDTFVLGSWSFDTDGAPDPQGWTTHDLTAQIDTFFHVAGYSELYPYLNPIDGSQSLWCGQANSAAEPFCSWTALPGYGNNWVQCFESKTFSLSGLALSYTISWDIEPGDDYAFLEMLDSTGAWVALPVYYNDGYYDGTGLLDECFEIDFEGETRFRFGFVSDGAWSDEDGFWPTDGALLLDNILLRNANGDTLSFEDFESEPAGAKATLDGHWMATTKQPFGNFAALHDGNALLQEDPCASVSSSVWGFLDDPAGTNYTCGGWPLQGAVPYGPDANGFYINNEIWSPWVPITGSGSDMRLTFRAYRDLPLDNLVFYEWRVRCRDDDAGGCPGPWHSDNFLYYGGDKAWVQREFDINRYFEGTHIQVALGIKDECSEWCGVLGTGDCHSHAPLFDDVRVIRLQHTTPRFSVRPFDLFQDTFSEDGTITGTARADAALNISSSYIQPGDSVLLWEVTDPDSGITTDPYTGVGPAIYAYVALSPRNQTGKAGMDLQAPETRPKVGLRFPLVDSLSVGGITWHCFRVDSVDSWSLPEPDRFCFDLNDAVLTPGDTLRYFFSAKNETGGISYLSRDANGQGTIFQTDYINQVLASPMEFTILPAGGWRRGGCILYVDDADDRGGPAPSYFDSAFDELGIRDSVDRYDVLGASSGVDNGLGSRVQNIAQQLIACYRIIIWSSGNLSEATLGDGTGYPDKSDDCQLLHDFLDQHTGVGAPIGEEIAGVWITGDNVAEEWVALSGAGAQALRSDYLNFDLVNGDHVAYGLGVSPTVIGAGSCFTHDGVPDSLVASGECPVINDFDVLGPAGTSSTDMNYAGGGAALVGQSTENSQNVPVRAFLSGFDYHYTVNQNGEFLPAGVVLLRDILTCLNCSIPDLTGIDELPGVRNQLMQNYPNPFNPITNIKYYIKARGHVSLKIYNVTGQLIRTLVDEIQTPRPEGFTVHWDGTNNAGKQTASGVYFYRLVAGPFSDTKKMLILR